MQSDIAKDYSLGEEVALLRRELARRARQLAESEARFRDVIERNADAIVVVDDEGVIRFANAMAAESFGRPARELVGTSFGFPLVAGETTELELLANGGMRVAEMRVVSSEWEGEPALIASLRDITERRRAEDSARRLAGERAARVVAEASANRLRFLLESTALLSASLDYATTMSALARLCVAHIADWVVVYDLDERGRPRRLEVAHADPEKAGLAAELRDIPIAPDGSHPVLDMLRTRQPRLVAEVTDAMLERMSEIPRELEIARALGVASFIQVPMIARDRPVGAIALVCASEPFDQNDLALAQDVAGRAALAIDNARLYGEAQHANQTKTDFLAVVSHDLRTPLNAIIGYSQLLELGVPAALPPESLVHVDRIRTAARHLVYLINELLEFSRLDAGREEAAARPIDACVVGREVATVSDPLVRERGLLFEVDLPSEPIPIRTDPDKLRQILLNLVGNAARYTSTGSVRLSMRATSDGGVQAEVRDTGQGIAAEHLPHVFIPFWQVDRSQRTRGGGTGLGLSIVRRLIDLLEGTITVASEPGVGSTFTVRLPGRLTTND